MSNRPSPQYVPNRAAWAVLLGAALLGACDRTPDGSEDNRTALELPPAITNVVDAVPLPAPPLDRTALLEAVALAASAHAAGTDDRAAQAALSGRRFALRIRFGCDGPSPADSDAPLRWSAEPGADKIKVSATPDLTLDPKSLASRAGEEVEEVEGFWIPRPWLLNDGCPARAPDEELVATAPERTVGIAQYFTTADSRVRRRSGRAYSTTAPLDPSSVLPSDGLVMLIEGRLRPWPEGKVIRCTGSGRAARPACIASAKIDRVAIERPAGEVLAEWTN